MPSAPQRTTRISRCLRSFLSASATRAWTVACLVTLASAQERPATSPPTPAPPPSSPEDRASRGSLSEIDAALARDPKTLPRAPSGHWKGFDPARLTKEDLPAGMLDARDALLAGHLPRALAALQSVLERAPDFPPAWHQMGVLYFRLQRYGDAAVCLERYLEVVPERVGETRVLAHCYYSLGQFERARRHYELVLAQHPDEVEALRGHALAVMRGGDLPRALSELQHVVELDPRHEDAQLWIAQIQFDLDHLDEALVAARLARDIDPFSARCWYLLGQILAASGKEDEARQAEARHRTLNAIAQELRSLDNRLQYTPGDPNLLRRIVELHRQAGDTARVRASLALCFRAFPESIELRLWGLGILESLGDFEAGRMAAATLERIGADDPLVWTRLEQFYARAKDRVKQIEAGERARRLSAK